MCFLLETQGKVRKSEASMIYQGYFNSSTGILGSRWVGILVNQLESNQLIGLVTAWPRPGLYCGSENHYKNNISEVPMHQASDDCYCRNSNPLLSWWTRVLLPHRDISVPGLWNLVHLAWEVGQEGAMKMDYTTKLNNSTSDNWRILTEHTNLLTISKAQNSRHEWYYSNKIAEIEYITLMSF